MSDEEAGNFFQALLWQLGDAFVDGNFTRLAEHVQAGQARVYDEKSGRFQYNEAPFTPFTKPLADARLMLLTSSGHFVAGDDPRPLGIDNMTQAEAVAQITQFLRRPPTLSEIPTNTPTDKLRVRHGGYDVRAAQADPNVNLPLAHLRDMVAEGVFAELANPAYSFVGAAAQTPLLKNTGPAWVEKFQALGVDGAVLVPV
ncbi:MAG: hypothetical protein KC419_16605 [Anaerolineales bacterium]|nr:hypothetical protein [Anaerolineales bacterium]